MEGILRIATRGSRLALAQYEIISKVLAERGIKCEPIITQSHGESDYRTPLYDMKEQGIFVKRLNDMILSGAVDAAVHSAKDIPSEIDQDLNISFYSRRGDPRDFFVSRGGMDNFSGTVGSSSIRRKMFLSLYNRNLKFINIRGNVETRIRKWERGEADSIVIAKTAIDRLGLNPPGQIIPEEICPPDPNQGFIAVVTRKGSSAHEIFRAAQEEEPLWEASLERELMTKLNLGCNVAASIRAIFHDKVVRFSYANEENRFDLSFKGEPAEAELNKLRDIIGK
jgi:hydroxymethylbilane synthase